MEYLWSHIDYIIWGILALGILPSACEVVPRTEYQDFDETAWATSKVNPCSPFYDSGRPI